MLRRVRAEACRLAPRCIEADASVVKHVMVDDLHLSVVRRNDAGKKHAECVTPRCKRSRGN